MELPERGLVEIELDRPRHLCFTMAGVRALETQTQRSFWEMVDNVTSVSDMLTVLWAGLIHEDPELRESQMFALAEKAPGRSLLEKCAYIRSNIARSLKGIYSDEETKKFVPGVVEDADAR